MSVTKSQESSEIPYLITYCFESDENNYSNVKRFLKSYSNNFVFRFNATKLSSLISLLNVNLNKPLNSQSRNNALLILDGLLPQCSSEIFIDNAVFWMQICLKNSENSLFRPLELKILEFLLSYSVQFSDVRRNVSCQILNQFMGQITFSNNASSETIYWELKCIATFLINYSEACGSYKGRIISILNHVLKTQSNKSVINAAAQCYALTTQCGPKGKGNIKYISNWSEQVDGLINTLNFIINEILKNITFESEEPAEQLYSDLLTGECNKTDSNLTEKYFALQSNFTIVSKLLCYMFGVKFCTKKVFDPKKVLKLIFRILNFNFKSLTERPETNDILIVKLILPEIHASAFEILRSVIKCASRNLIRYGPSICRACVQALVCSRFKCDSTSEHIISYGKIRESAYKSLSLWLTVATTSSSIEQYAEEIVRELITDIKYDKDPIVLLKHNKHSAKPKGNVSNAPDQNKLFNDFERNLKIPICIKAHTTLQLFIKHTAFAKFKYYQALQSAIISQLTEIMIDKKESTIYHSDECRLKLYESLLTLITEPPANQRTPISFAFELFTKGTLHSNSEISRYCAFSLSILRSIIHPRGPTLNLQCPNEVSSDQFSNYDTNLTETSATNFNSDITEIVESEKSPPGSIDCGTNLKANIAYESDKSKAVVVLKETMCTMKDNNVDNDGTIEEIKNIRKEISKDKIICTESEVDNAVPSTTSELSSESVEHSENSRIKTDDLDDVMDIADIVECENDAVDDIDDEKLKMDYSEINITADKETSKEAIIDYIKPINKMVSEQSIEDMLKDFVDVTNFD